MVQNTVVSSAEGDTFNSLKLDEGILLHGPLPADFMDRFAMEVAKVTGCKPADIRVFNTTSVSGTTGTNEIVWEAPPDIISAVEEQAKDPHSDLAKGPLRLFLNSKGGVGSEATEETEAAADALKKGTKHKLAKGKHSTKGGHSAHGEHDTKGKVHMRPDKHSRADEEGDEENRVQEKGIDVDSDMPYGEIEPFGREDTAAELTRASIAESDGMVDQIERAEVAEEKRAVFRALTRLRGAAITSFDGVARAQTGNIDTYARDNHWRSSHPVRHLANEEGDTAKWAFPDSDCRGSDC